MQRRFRGGEDDGQRPVEVCDDRDRVPQHNGGKYIGPRMRGLARPGAFVVMRSFSERPAPDEERWAQEDRALLWGSIKMSTA